MLFIDELREPNQRAANGWQVHFCNKWNYEKITEILVIFYKGDIVPEKRNFQNCGDNIRKLYICVWYEI